MSTREPTSGSSAQDSGQPSFAMAWRGYDRDQVAGYVKGMLGRMHALQARVDELEAQLEEGPSDQVAGAAGARGDNFAAISEWVAEAMRALDQDLERMRTEAQAEARRTVTEARAEAEREAREIVDRRQEVAAEAERALAGAMADADRIRSNAETAAQQMRAQAEHVLADARARAGEALSGLDERRQRMLAEIRDLHARIVGTARALEPVLRDDRPVGALSVEEGDVAVQEGDGSARIVSPAE